MFYRLFRNLKLQYQQNLPRWLEPGAESRDTKDRVPSQDLQYTFIAVVRDILDLTFQAPN